MPKKPPSDRPRAKGGPPVFKPRTEVRRVPPPPRKKCETNPKRIARRRRASTYITPRFHRRGTTTPQKCETNPICPYPSLAHDPITQNEPNSSRGGPVADQKMRNEPNLDINSHKSLRHKHLGRSACGHLATAIVISSGIDMAQHAGYDSQRWYARGDIMRVQEIPVQACLMPRFHTLISYQSY